MKKKKVIIEYDTPPEDCVDMIIDILDTLGVKYKISEKDDVIIEYEIERE